MDAVKFGISADVDFLIAGGAGFVGGGGGGGGGGGIDAWASLGFRSLYGTSSKSLS